MARNGKLLAVVTGVEYSPPPEERPEGALRFADPSAAAFPRAVHTFDPPDYRSTNAQSGRDMAGGVRSMTGTLVPWESRQPYEDSWEAMNRKRGVIRDEEEV
jgi:hypothetical protein